MRQAYLKKARQSSKCSIPSAGPAELGYPSPNILTVIEAKFFYILASTLQIFRPSTGTEVLCTHTYLYVPILGLTQWNLRCFEFKFDDTHNMKIRLAQLKFFLLRSELCLCPVGCLSLAFLNWDSQQGRDIATSGHNKIKIQSGQSYSYIMRKVWYHQI